MARRTSSSRRRHVPRTYDRSGDGGTTARTTVAGVSAGELFETVVQDVMRSGEEIGFDGVVDVQLDISSTAVDSNGILMALISGRDENRSSNSIKLATRVYLGDMSPTQDR